MKLSVSAIIYPRWTATTAIEYKLPSPNTSTIFQTSSAFALSEDMVTVYNETDVDHMENTDGATLAIIIINIPAAVIEVIGILLNLIVIRVMTSQAFSDLPHSFFSLALGVTNLCGLVLMLVSKILAFVYDTDPLMISQYSCKVFVFLSFFFSQMDVSLILLICIERLVILCKPLHAAIILTRSRVRTLVIVCTIFFLIWNVDVLFTSNLVMTKSATNETRLTCQYAAFFAKQATDYVFIKAILNDLITYGLPYIAIIVLNVVIIIRMRRRRQAAKELGANEKRVEKDTRKVTKTALSISFALVILLLPSFAYYLSCIIKGTTNCINYENPMHHVFLVLCTSVSWTVNFLLYFLTGSMFRREVRNFLTC